MKPLGRFSLLPRKKSSSKNDHGHALILAGSLSYPGAALLAAQACSRAGAGLVTLAVPASIQSAILRRFPPQVMPLFLPSSTSGSVSRSALARLKKAMEIRRVNCLALGPGLSRDPGTAWLVRRLIKEVALPAVVDADALNAFEGRLAALSKHRGPLVLTPHAGEFRRLFKKKLPEGKVARARLGEQCSNIVNGVLVLKGHGTQVVEGRREFRCPTGNPGMAKGGSGDVLTGIIAAFLAQGMDPFSAAAWGVYFHGKAGDLAAKKAGVLSMTGTDLLEALPGVLRGK